MQLIQDKYAVKSEIDNDVNVRILGEAKYGAGVGCDDIIGAFVGTGIGGGLVLNSKLYTGNSGLVVDLGSYYYQKRWRILSRLWFTRVLRSLCR